EIANKFAKILTIIAKILLEGITLCERREHYREWLGSQNIIHSIKNAEIEENGVMEILPRNKCPGYSGYPSTAESHDNNCKATPRPSHPRMTTLARDLRILQNQTSDTHRTKTD